MDQGNNQASVRSFAAAFASALSASFAEVTGSGLVARS